MKLETAADIVAEVVRRAERLGLLALPAGTVSGLVGDAAEAVKRAEAEGSVGPGAKSAVVVVGGAAALRVACGGWMVSVASLTAEEIARQDRKVRARLVAYEVEAGSRVIASLVQSARDLEQSASHEREVAAFTRQLTLCFESVTLHNRLGRAMGEFRTPAKFIEDAARGTAELLECRWCAVALAENPRLLGGLSGQVILWSADGDREGVAARARRLSERLRPSVGGDIYALDDEPQVAGEVIAHTLLVDGQAAGMLLIGAKEDAGERATSFDTQTAETVAGILGAMLQSRRLYEEQEITYLGALRALTGSLDAKDRYTRGHSERVALLGRQLAIAVGMDEEKAARVHLCGTLHDIGKLGVPDRVLLKAGRLTDDEYELIKMHPSIGCEILAPIPSLEDILPGVRHHHERWDGRGYPDGLSGSGIPLMARVLALADTFDALSSNRAYRDAKPRSWVLDEIARCSGQQFDPALVPAFLSMDFAAFDALMIRHGEERVDQQQREAA